MRSLCEKNPTPTILIHCDSTTTITKIENHYYNSKRRQIRRKHNIVRDCISNGDIRVDHISIRENLANPLTKGLAREKFYNTSKEDEINSYRVMSFSWL